MPWAKFDDQYPDNPKIVIVGPLGMALHTAATCYSARYLTDGFIPAAMIPRLVNFDGIRIERNGVTNAVTTKDITNDLVIAGLFEVTDGGYLIHDYSEYNPPSEQVKRRKEESAERQRRWREEHRNEKGEFEGDLDSNAVTNGVTNALQDTAPSPSPSPINDSSSCDTDRPTIFRVYETEIGALSPMAADALLDAEKTYPKEWLPVAIRAAVLQGHRRWSYVEGILKNWKEYGYLADTRKKYNAQSFGNGHGKEPTKAQRIADNNRDVLRRALEKGATDGNTG